jgi:hypothetical protein
MKVDKKKIGYLLIFVMVLSSFAYAFIQGYYAPTNKDQELPKERKISFLSENQRILAISQGYTIIYLNYTSPNSEVRSYLNSLTINYKVYLIENQSNEDYLKIESLKGSREIKNPTLNQTIDLLCKIMIDMPIDCVLREIK